MENLERKGCMSDAECEKKSQINIVMITTCTSVVKSRILTVYTAVTMTTAAYVTVNCHQSRIWKVTQQAQDIESMLV